MPVNFDEMREKEDRDFIVRGETFTVRHVRPEVMDQINVLEAAFAELEDVTYADIVKLAEDRLLLLIDDKNGAADRWKALRLNEDDPVEFGEIMDISRRAFEMVSGIPTLPPAPSTSGAGKTAGSSKAGSS